MECVMGAVTMWWFCETVTPPCNGTHHIAVPKIVISLVFIPSSSSLMCHGFMGHMHRVGFIESFFCPFLTYFALLYT